MREGEGGGFAGLEFKAVADVAEEVEAVVWGPEEGVREDGCGVGALARVFGKHAADKVFGFPLVVAEVGEVLDVVGAFDDVGFAHVFAVFVEGVVARGEDVVEDAAEGEDVNGAGGAAVGLGVEN